MHSFDRRVAIVLVALAAAVGVSARVSAQSGPAERYEALLEQEIRLVGSPASTADDFRVVINRYWLLVRRYPLSGYADNALWHAATLSGHAFDRFTDDRDRHRAVQLFQWLRDQYPHSPLRPKASAQLDFLADPLLPPQPETTIRSVQREVLPEIVRVTVELDREVRFFQERIEGPARVFFDLSGTKAVPALVDATLRYDSDIVRHIRLGRHPNTTTRIVLDLENVRRYSVFTLYNPYRIVIDAERNLSAQAVFDASRRTTPNAQHAAVRPASASPSPNATARSASAPSTQGAAAGQAEIRVETPIAAARQIPASISAAPPASITPRRPAVTPAPQVPSGTQTADADFETAGTVDARIPKPVVPATRKAPAPPRATQIAPTVVTPAARVARTAPNAPVAPPAPDPPGKPLQPSANLSGKFSVARQLGLGVSRIVIDAGHGGHDPGASAFGVAEAELVLDVAQRLERLLVQQPGMEVELTRRTDDFLSLEERTEIANRESADLFLSIHANASASSTARGVETYFLNFALNPQAEAVAARENAASGRTMNSLPGIIKAITMNSKLNESREFAESVQRALVRGLRPSNKSLKDLGVKQAPFMVLIGASMPSVLAEISFVTNTQEARLLKTAAYRQKIAESLLAGILRYQQSLKKVQSAALK